MKHLIFLLLTIFLITPQLQAETTTTLEAPATILREANELFATGKDLPESERSKRDEMYRKALLRYEQLTTTNGIHNAGLYYNIANIYYLLGDLGHAILNYRRAYALDANDSNIQSNLNFVRERRLDKFEDAKTASTLKTIFFWHYTLSAASKIKIAILTSAIFWLLIIVRITTHIKVSRIFISLALLICIALSSSVVLQDKNKAGVITATEVIARKGDGLSYEPSFTAPLHAGTEVKILEKRQDWINVELSNASTCWLPSNSIEEV